MLGSPIHKITNKHTHTEPRGAVPGPGMSLRAPLMALMAEASVRAAGTRAGGRAVPLPAGAVHVVRAAWLLLGATYCCSLEMDRKSYENFGTLGANGLQVSKGFACQGQRREVPELEKTESWDLIGQKKFAWSVGTAEIPLSWNSHWQEEAPAFGTSN